MKITKNFAILYGILLGDGCLSNTSKARYICITCDRYSDKELFKKLTPIIEKIRGKKIQIKDRGTHGTIEIKFSDKKMFETFKKIGFPVGKKGVNLFIPKIFKNHLKEVIQGHFATDGCVVITNNNGIRYPRIEFSSISKGLLEQINKYLINSNIRSKIYLSKRYTNGWNNLYRIQINGKKQLCIFEEKIGFFNPKHKKIADSFK